MAMYCHHAVIRRGLLARLYILAYFMIDHWNKGHQFDYACGWRYLLSPVYRRQVKAKRGGNLWSSTLCLPGGVIGIVMTSAVAMIPVMAVWELLSL